MIAPYRLDIHYTVDEDDLHAIRFECVTALLDAPEATR